MIQIKNLTKIYKSKKAPRCIALNDLTFTLPDKGLVFIIGKSGSGKSTLLNMLGGLDNMTSGEIIADGNKLSKLSKSQFNNYRGSYIGFIFQDYHLIDDLTIAQNIELALDISNIKDKSIISKMLAKVDLAGYEDRYPRELSGGQQQRVAIARALVKNPSLILGDEPTGNLDRNTSTQVLELLKEVSKEKLVIIVSHNLEDADKYADRIIELYDGKILSDRQREQNYSNIFRLERGTLHLPHHKNLVKEEIDFILENKEKIKRVKQIGDGFFGTEDIEYVEENKPLHKTRLKTKKALRLFWLFFTKRKISKFFTVFMAVVMISVFYVVQALSNFDGNSALANDMVNNREQALVLRKAYRPEGSTSLNNSSACAITDEEYQKFKDDYNGHVYKLYNTTIYAKNSSIDNEQLTAVTSNNLFYLYETYGTLNCKEEFLVRKYGKNGKLNVLAGDLYANSYGTIITDYMADSILYYKSNYYSSYADLIGPYFHGSRQINYISAIIDTDYETKFSKVYDIYKRVLESGDVEFSLTRELANEPSYIDFLDEVNKYLGIGYNFSDDYINVINNSEYRLGYNIYNVKFNYDNYEYFESTMALYAYLDSKYNEELNPGEIILSFQEYNKIFGTEYNKDNLDEFIPHQITITKYFAKDKKEILFQETYTIVKLHAKSATLMMVDESDYYKLNIVDHLPYALYFDNPATTINVLGNAEKYNFVVLSNDNASISTVTRGIEIFGGLLDLIVIVLIVATIIYLVSVGTKNIKNNLFEIGVLKAMGARTRDLNKIFVLQSFVLGIAIFGLSLLGMFVASLVANEILVASFETMLGVKFYKLKIVSFYPLLAFIDLFVVLFIIFISSLIPTLFLRRFKPVDILKAKE